MPALLVIGVVAAVGFGAVWLVQHRAPRTTVDAPPHARGGGYVSPGDQRKTAATEIPAATLNGGVQPTKGGRTAAQSPKLHTDVTAFTLTPHTGGVTVDAPPPGEVLKAIEDVRNANAAGYKAVQWGPAPGDRALTAAWTYPDAAADGSLPLNASPGTWDAQLSKFRQDASKWLLKYGFDLQQLAGRMSDQEWWDFWCLGVVPVWMVPQMPAAPLTVGQWGSPFLQQVMTYGADGGMWNAITNTWTNSVIAIGQAAAGGVSGVIAGGGKAVVAGLDGGKGLSN